jgi:hypothetical protein
MGVEIFRAPVEVRVIAHLQPAEVLVERGVTQGVTYCRTCREVTVHYVTCPGDDDTAARLWASDGETFTWRCEKCQELVDLNSAKTLLAIFACEARLAEIQAFGS